MIIPRIQNINPIDAKTGATIYFEYTGSKQVVGNELVIKDVSTSLTVYTFTNSTYEKKHDLPPNILTNGKIYTAEIRVQYGDNTYSGYSVGVKFHALSRPVLDIISIDGQGYVYNKDVTFQAQYSQLEGDIIKRYRFSLYDENNFLMKNYPMRYNTGNMNMTMLEELVRDLEKSKGYYIEITVETHRGMTYSHKEKFIALFIVPSMDGSLKVRTSNDTGFVNVEAFLKQITGTNVVADGEENDYEYLDNEWIIIPSDNPLIFTNLEMNKASDFISKVWFKDIPFNSDKPFMSIVENDKEKSIDFYRKSDRVIAVKTFGGVEARYTSNKLMTLPSDAIYMYTRVIEHRIEIKIVKG